MDQEKDLQTTEPSEQEKNFIKRLWTKAKKNKLQIAAFLIAGAMTVLAPKESHGDK